MEKFAEVEAEAFGSGLVVLSGSVCSLAGLCLPLPALLGSAELLPGSQHQEEVGLRSGKRWSTEGGQNSTLTGFSEDPERRS